MIRLPFTTDDVRDQCAQFGDAPLAHPLPVKHLLLMCRHIDDLEKALADAQPKYRDDWLAMKRRAEAAELRALDAELAEKRMAANLAHQLAMREHAEAKWAEYQAAAEAYANDANNLKLRIDAALALCESELALEPDNTRTIYRRDFAREVRALLGEELS